MNIRNQQIGQGIQGAAIVFLSFFFLCVCGGGGGGGGGRVGVWAACLSVDNTVEISWNNNHN